MLRSWRSRGEADNFTKSFMENFEEKLQDLFASKLLKDARDINPILKDSLEALLEHVYKKVLALAYYRLTEHDQFALSSLTPPKNDEFDDALGDGMGYRPMAVFKIVRLHEPLFEYWLSFDGDVIGENRKVREASLWRKVEIHRGPAFDPENPPADLFDFMDDSKPGPFKEYIGKSNLDEDAVYSIEEYHKFPTLDIDEAVRLVKEDLYKVLETLL
jgi:hypothetical protein